ncbi:MAG TPA: HAMP domain-containing sensor histidine kinase [Ktedonobacterales bacterium]
MDGAVRTLARHIARFFGGVRIRMTLWYLAILALVFVVFGGIVSASAIQQDQSAQRGDLTTLATTLSATYDATHGTLQIQDPWDNVCTAAGKQQQVGKQIAVTPFVPGDIAVLLNAGDDPVQSFGPLSAQAIARIQTLAAQFSGGNSSVGIFPTIALPTVGCAGNVSLAPYTLHFAPIMGAGRQVAMLVVGQPTESTRTLSVLVPGLLIAGPLTLLVAALGGYWLATRALRPVRLIALAAEEIEESDLSRRLNLKSRDELGALAATFDRMLARLDAAFARQRQFTGDASHELRTPLSIVAAEAERALAVPRTPEEYRRALGVIQSENAYMGQVVGQLLTLVRADAGQLQLRDDPLDLSDVTLEVVERLAPLAHERGVVLSTGALPELWVRGDRTALGLALGNLVENAIKYAGRAGQAERGRVRVETGAAADRAGGQRVAWVSIEDDGPGIAPEHLPHLFERFYRADVARTRDDAIEGQTSGAPDGSGLGLAIAHEIARAHGGAIRVESVVGCGSTFTFELPAE